MRSKYPLLLLAAAISCTAAYGQQEKAEKEKPAIAGSSFYQDKERGWFWYEEPEPEPEPEKEPEPPPPAAATPPAPEPAAAPAEPELPPTGSVAWIKIMLPKLKEAAIDNPTDENIEAYYFAQRLMLDKSERFSRRSMDVIRNQPLLDEDLRYPASNAASDALATAAGHQKEALMKMVAKSSALMLFYKGDDCALCEQAVSALSALEFKYGFTIMPVSLDGNPLPGGKYQSFQYDTGLADSLGIFMTPAIAMVVPPNEVKVISYSTISMETAVPRILGVARDSGLITEEEFASTSRLAPIGLIDPADLADAPGDATKKPTEFINHMREAARQAFKAGNGGSQ